MKHRPGLTLLELLISMAILGIIVVVVSNLFIAAAQYTASEQTRITVGESNSRIFSTLDRTVRQGKAILSSATINSVLYNTSDMSMVFTLPSIQIDGTLTPTTSDTAVLFTDTIITNNHRLRLIIEPDASSYRDAVDQIITDHVADVYFRYNDEDPTMANSVTITVTNSQSILGRAFTQRNLVNLTLRNNE